MAKRQILSNIHVMRLYPYIEQAYKESGLVDADFAARAAEQLGFTVTENQVRFARDQMKILSNAPVKAPKVTAKSAVERLTAVEAQLADAMIIIHRHEETISMLNTWRLERTLSRAVPSKRAAKRRGA